MNASSQTPGALPSVQHDPRPLQAAIASYATVHPAPAGPVPVNPDVPHRLQARGPEPLPPACFTCGASDGPLAPCPLGRRYPSGAQVLYCGTCMPHNPATAAATVITAAMDGDATTPQDIAQAEADAGLLFDPQRVQAAVDAAREQARAECAAELRERGEQLAVMADYKHRLDAVLRMLEGRPGTHMLAVAEVAAAAYDWPTPHDLIPMTLAWTRSATVPAEDAEDQRAVVDCVSAHGGRAHLVLTGDERHALASLLDSTVVRDINAPCPHSKACGMTDDEVDAADPHLFGWARLEVAGVDDGPRWYCTPACVFRALARAGERLEAADRQAEQGGAW
ncbi:hypothetical protein [Streptomyces sp. NPDC057877]|uniref:hypothetical protein n=1 Tax=Streptomyces sp. NPDC057877 TaxID=3346269 RepID=UPI0036CAB1D9